ncbi:MAG: response regulator transcription factor [Anaerolineae bacterium]|nr:response regulator transcription factor [Anaerolineae bacterium]
MIIENPYTISQVRVLVVDEDSVTRRSLACALTIEGYPTDSIGSIETALHLLTTFDYDIILLNLPQNKATNTKLLQHMYAIDSDLQIMVLAPSPTLENALNFFRAGVADYLPKPCSNEDIVYAIKGVMQRYTRQIHRQQLMRTITDALSILQGQNLSTPTYKKLVAEETLNYGNITLDQEKRIIRITKGTKELTAELTRNEALILAYLIKHAETICASQELANFALGYSDMESQEAKNIIRPHISRLRSKLAVIYDGQTPLIHTVRRKGYLLSLSKESQS